MEGLQISGLRTRCLSVPHTRHRTQRGVTGFSWTLESESLLEHPGRDAKMWAWIPRDRYGLEDLWAPAVSRSCMETAREETAQGGALQGGDCRGA